MCLVLDPLDFNEAIRRKAAVEEAIRRTLAGRGGELATTPKAFGNPFQQGWKGYTNWANKVNKGMNASAGSLLKTYGPLAVLVDAGLEMTDTDDPVAVNLAEGVGSGAGFLGGAALGAKIAAPLSFIPGAPLVGGIAGGLLGSGILKDAARGIYKAFDPEVDQRKALKQQDRANELILKKAEAQMELLEQLEAIRSGGGLTSPLNTTGY